MKTNTAPDNHDPDSDHLGYLLTAYVFENLSPAGKAEVEAHLEHCAQCRAQLERLRATLGLTEEALNDSGITYTFEERRRQRVLEAAQRSRHSFLHRLDRPAFSFRDWRGAAIAAMAALVALALLIPASLPSMTRSRFAARSSAGMYSDETVIVTELSARPAADQPDADGGGGVNPVYESSGKFGGKPSEPLNTDDAETRVDTLTVLKTPAQSAPKKPESVDAPTKLTDAFGRVSGSSEPAPPPTSAVVTPTSPATPAPTAQPSTGGQKGNSAAPPKPSTKSKTTPASGDKDGLVDPAVPAPPKVVAPAIEGLNLNGAVAESKGDVAGGGGIDKKALSDNFVTAFVHTEVPSEMTFKYTAQPQNGANAQTFTGGALSGRDISGWYDNTGQTTEGLKRQNQALARQIQEQEQQSQSNRYGLSPAGSGPGATPPPPPPVSAPKPAESKDSDARDGEITKLKLDFNASRDRELQGQSNLREAAGQPASPDTLSGGVDKGGRARTDEEKRYLDERNKLRGVVLKQQQAVVLEEKSGDEKGALEKELNALKKENAELSRDLSKQTGRINSLIERGVPVVSLVNEDPAANPAQSITSDPATAAARTGKEAKANAEERLKQLVDQAAREHGQAGTEFEFAKRVISADSFLGNAKLSKKETAAREKVAIAAKDETIRNHAELLAKEKAEKDAFYDAKTRDKVIIKQAELAKKIDQLRGAEGATSRFNVPVLVSSDPALDAQVEAAKRALPQQLEALKKLQEIDTSTPEGRLEAQADKLKEELEDLRRVDNLQRGKGGEAVEMERLQEMASKQKPIEELQAEVSESAHELAELKKKIVRQSKQSPLQNQLDGDKEITVPQDILVKAELGDHFETFNLDRPETRSAIRNSTSDDFAATTSNQPVKLGTMGIDTSKWALARTDTSELKTNAPIAHERRERVAQEALVARERKTEQLKARMKEMLAQAEELGAGGDHLSAANMAAQVLKVDPLNAAAEEQKNKSKTLALLDAEKEKAARDQNAFFGSFQGDVNIDEAKNYFEAGRYGESVELAKKILKKDPTNAEANSIITVAKDIEFDARKKYAETEYNHRLELSRERAERMNIPHSDYLIYPDNWDQISKRSDSASMGLRPGVEEEWKKDIKKKLRGKVSFEYDGKTLEEVVKDLNGKTNAGIVLDPKVLESKGKEPITLRAKDMSADIALQWVAHVANLEVNLRDHGVFISAPKELAPNTAAVNFHDERTLRSFNFLREQSQDPRSVTLPEFLKRPAPIPTPVLTDEGLDEDAYIEKYGTRPFVDARRDNLSTFGMDVDTASYTLARGRLNANELPDPATVRVEEFVNYFKQPYAVQGEEAFAVFAEAAPSPFQRSAGFQPASLPSQGSSKAENLNYVELHTTPALQILKLGIKSRDPKPGERKPAQLTFALDTSGSMTKDDRLAMVRGALKNMVEKLNPDDTVTLVTFADQAQVALPRTQARQKQRILDALDALSSSGGTSVEAGLNLAYRLADESFSADAVNRVILCSDGVANIGAQGPESMLKTVKVFADRGIDLATVGFGKGQYNDEMLVKLANNGNGSCHFVDSADEARRVFTEQLPPNLSALARDAKVQVEFNPATVAKYRLLGYEKRKIADKDFRNDKIDAGEVQHSTLVTVLYELERVPAARGSLGKVFLRWKDAGHRHLPVIERNFPLDENIQSSSVESAPVNLRFLACVARFAELLRDSKWVKHSSYADVLEQLQALPADFQQRDDWKEVHGLVQKAQNLSVQKWLKALNP